MEGSAVPKGLKCSGIDMPSSITHRAFRDLRETYAVPTPVGLLCPTPGDRPLFPRCGFTAVTMASLQCGLRLPFPPIVQRLLTRLGVHACQMSPAFYRLVAMCYMECHCQTRRAMTVNDFRNLVAVFPAPGQPGLNMAQARHNMKLVTDADNPNRKT